MISRAGWRRKRGRRTRTYRGWPPRKEWKRGDGADDDGRAFWVGCGVEALRVVWWQRRIARGRQKRQKGGGRGGRRVRSRSECKRKHTAGAWSPVGLEWTGARERDRRRSGSDRDCGERPGELVCCHHVRQPRSSRTRFHDSVRATSPLCAPHARPLVCTHSRDDVARVALVLSPPR